MSIGLLIMPSIEKLRKNTQFLPIDKIKTNKLEKMDNKSVNCTTDLTKKNQNFQRCRRRRSLSLRIRLRGLRRIRPW